MADGFQAVVQELQAQREEDKRTAAAAENVAFDKLTTQLQQTNMKLSLLNQINENNKTAIVNALNGNDEKLRDVAEELKKEGVLGNITNQKLEELKKTQMMEVQAIAEAENAIKSNGETEKQTAMRVLQLNEAQFRKLEELRNLDKDQKDALQIMQQQFGEGYKEDKRYQRAVLENQRTERRLAALTRRRGLTERFKDARERFTAGVDRIPGGSALRAGIDKLTKPLRGFLGQLGLFTVALAAFVNSPLFDDFLNFVGEGGLKKLYEDVKKFFDDAIKDIREGKFPENIAKAIQTVVEAAVDMIVKAVLPRLGIDATKREREITIRKIEESQTQEIKNETIKEIRTAIVDDPARTVIARPFGGLLPDADKILGMEDSAFKELKERLAEREGDARIETLTREQVAKLDILRDRNVSGEVERVIQDKLNLAIARGDSEAAKRLATAVEREGDRLEDLKKTQRALETVIKEQREQGGAPVVITDNRTAIDQRAATQQILPGNVPLTTIGGGFATLSPSSGTR